ncbi:hypothetical protein [Curtobacterium sp. VKM Ac-1376]|uniref:family 4 glycosyl hydrolase n=1 Tax=Curtobacterium sp. VKM Ac-1376 TaxID=123312 RepID=UPI001E437391|nr:hypothetical protein [Curtobacterium sp. VKM Ac-1376]
MRYFHSHDISLQEQLREPTRAQVVMATERALLAKYADESVVTKPAELEQRGGAYYSEAAIDVLSSILGDRGDVQVLNVRNDGTFPFLPDDHVIEVASRVTRLRRGSTRSRPARTARRLASPPSGTSPTTGAAVPGPATVPATPSAAASLSGRPRR